MTNRISETIKRLFPNELEELIPVKQHWWETIDYEELLQGWRLWAIIGFTAIVIFMSVHYYNRFVVLETKVLTAKAQIEAHMQRRKDLIVNLTRTVIDYSEHERKMFIYMADKRADSLGNSDKISEEINKVFGSKGTLSFKDGKVDLSQFNQKDLSSMMAGLMALAENYPELKLSSNFQKLMDALINIEDRIVEMRMAYNESCNIYGTYIRKFPQNVYAFMFRFGQYPFVSVDEDVELFDRVSY